MREYNIRLTEELKKADELLLKFYRFRNMVSPHRDQIEIPEEEDFIEEKEPQLDEPNSEAREEC